MNEQMLLQVEIAVAKLENCRAVTSELIRLGIAIGKGNTIEAVVESNRKVNKLSLGRVQVKMTDGTSFYFC